MLAAMLAAAAPLAAQTSETIENIAQLRWDDGGTPREVSSNRVTLAIESRRAAIATFHIASGGPQRLTFSAGSCAPAGGTQSFDVEPADAFQVGEAVLFVIEAGFANRDPAAIDSIALVFTTTGGDRQSLTVAESGPDTGRFIGSIPTAPAPGGIVPEDCRLSVQDGDVITLAAAGAAADSVALRRAVRVLADPLTDTVTLTQRVSRPVALPGDAVLFTLAATNSDPARPSGDVRITVRLPRALRLQSDTIRIDGAALPGAVTIAPDGSRFTVTLGALAAGRSRTIAYAATVRADAGAGQVESLAEVADGRARASAVVRIERDTLAGRMTIIGRVVAGDCRRDRNAPGLAGIRIMLEDGSFAITDADGRYRFEGVVPGTHVVQLARATLPQGARRSRIAMHRPAARAIPRRAS